MRFEVTLKTSDKEFNGLFSMRGKGIEKQFIGYFLADQEYIKYLLEKIPTSIQLINKSFYFTISDITWFQEDSFLSGEHSIAYLMWKTQVFSQPLTTNYNFEVISDEFL